TMTSSPAPLAAKPPTLHGGLRGPVLSIYLIVGLGLGGFLTWTASAPLSGGASMPGRVAVESNRQTVQHLEGGIISEILVKDGDRVAVDQILVRLSDVRVRANLQVLTDRLHASLAQRARLVAERDNAAEVSFPDRLLAAAQSPLVAEQIRAQQIAFTSRRDTKRGQVVILRQRIEQLSRQKEGLQAQLEANKLQIGTINQELTGLRRLFAEGLAPKTRILALERSAADLNGRLGQLISDIARSDVAVGEAQLQIDQVDNTFRSDVVQDLEKVEREIAELEEQRTAALDQMARTEIRAPVAGIVVGLAVHTVNGVIAPGGHILDIVPQDQTLVVEAFVKPEDIDKVQPGETAEVRFSAFSTRTTPSVEGTVDVVSADVLSDPQGKQSYYLARIVVAEDQIARLGAARLVPGMPAEVIVNTGNRTALEYLLKPVVDMFARSFKED
ncbi:HlyD family type I secretion periplasmic adaptor subunit, partial [Zavarzinia sp.]|uniref:HlyD family type I secretion periplasmic adaptor subunit n=1 Tax=Zavarzinia sp. TaxID=2027920 RepID=UPI003BB6B830